MVGQADKSEVIKSQSQQKVKLKLVCFSHVGTTLKVWEGEELLQVLTDQHSDMVKVFVVQMMKMTDALNETTTITDQFKTRSESISSR